MSTHLGQLSLSLPRAGERVVVTAMQLASDVASDTDTGGSSAGIGHGARNV